MLLFLESINIKVTLLMAEIMWSCDHVTMWDIINSLPMNSRLIIPYCIGYSKIYFYFYICCSKVTIFLSFHWIHHHIASTWHVVHVIHISPVCGILCAVDSVLAGLTYRFHFWHFRTSSGSMFSELQETFTDYHVFIYTMRLINIIWRSYQTTQRSFRKSIHIIPI